MTPMPECHDNDQLQFQPIVNVETGQVDAYQLLHDAPALTPTLMGLALRSGMDACEAPLSLRCPLDPDAPAWSVERASEAALSRGLPRHRLRLEFTLPSRDANVTVAAAVRRCRGLGIASVLDGFAAGGADFSLLQMVRPDFLVLAPELIRNIDASASRQQILNAILRMATNLQIRIVVRDVRTSGEIATLHAMGVTMMAGPRIALPRAGTLPMPETPTPVQAPATCALPVGPRFLRRDRPAIRDPRDYVPAYRLATAARRRPAAPVATATPTAAAMRA
ncbi:MAG: EAL domain-containing protein [Pseudomonadota bacterium]